MKNPKKILIVEDEEIIQNLCKRILDKAGYKIVFASGVKEAADRIKSSDDLDLLITDMRLPDGTGIEVILGFRRKYPSTKILIVTGSPSPETRMGEIFKMGITEDDILSKPFGMKEFEFTISKHLEGV